MLGELAQGRQSVYGGAAPQNDLLDLRFGNGVLPALALGGPGGGVLPVEKHDVKVLGLGELPQFVDLLLGIHVTVRGDLRHQFVTVARNALQSDAQHAVHVTVGLRRLKEANALVVGVAHQAGELVLPQLALHAATEGAGAEGKARHLDAGFAQRHPIRRRLAGCEQRQASCTRHRRSGQSSLKEVTPGKVRHNRPPIGDVAISPK